MTSNKRKIHQLASVIMIILILCFTLTGCSSDKELSIEVEDISKNELVLKFNNDTDSNLSLGWVDSCEIILETTEDTYYFETSSIDSRIKRGTSLYYLDISECDGEITRIEITDLRKLSDRGLPDAQLKNIVVYDVDNGIESYSGSFPFLGSDKGKFVIIISVIGTIMLIFITVIIIVAIHVSKSNKKAAAQFTPFNHGQSTDAYYHDQVIRENNRIQNDMNNMAHQQSVNMHNQAHQHAVDINNHNNGFTPPPAPPNF